MKTRTLFQLGGIALILSAVLFGIGNLMFFLSGAQAQTTLGYWIGILGGAFQVLGLCALFARQATRGGILGLIGFVLLVWENMTAVGIEAVGLGVVAGVFTEQQLGHVPSYGMVSAILLPLLIAGEVLLGISIYRAQVFPKYAGALVVLVGVLHLLTFFVAFTAPIFAALTFVTYVWLGWMLFTGKGMISPEPMPAP